MAKIKSYTDLGQSEKLSEFLPIESADMWWAERYAGQCTIDGQYIVEEKPLYYLSFTKPSEYNYSQDIIKDIPCWSLAALLNVLTEPSLHKTFSGWRCDSYNKEGTSLIMGIPSNDPIDACYEMILRLHEQNLL